MSFHRELVIFLRTLIRNMRSLRAVICAFYITRIDYISSQRHSSTFPPPCSHSIPNIRRKFPGYPEDFRSRRLRERRRTGAASFPRLLRSSNLTARARVHVSSFHRRKNVREHESVVCRIFPRESTTRRARKNEESYHRAFLTGAWKALMLIQLPRRRNEISTLAREHNFLWFWPLSRHIRLLLLRMGLSRIINEPLKRCVFYRITSYFYFEII